MLQGQSTDLADAIALTFAEEVKIENDELLTSKYTIKDTNIKSITAINEKSYTNNNFYNLFLNK
jgi:hypothetical protein